MTILKLCFHTLTLQFYSSFQRSLASLISKFFFSELFFVKSYFDINNIITKKYFNVTQIFGADCAGVDLGKEASKWITQYLNKCHATSKEFRILYHPYSPGKYEKNFYEKKQPDELIPQMR